MNPRATASIDIFTWFGFSDVIYELISSEKETDKRKKGKHEIKVS